MNLIKHEDMTVDNEERIKCYDLMREYGLKCSEFIHGHVWHMPDIEKEQWFVFIAPEDSQFTITTTVKINPPTDRYDRTDRIITSNTDRVDTYKDFKYILEYLINEYNKCKKKLKELLIREAAYVYET